jgi:phosphoglycerate dehydrogenase-like enzyme
MTQKIAAALSRSEMAAFFPGSLSEELFSLTGPEGLFDPNQEGANWPYFLKQLRPAALVSHWSTPRLPDDAADYLNYVAHVTGAVRNLLPREFLERGVRVTNWGDGAAETVAEGTLMLILSALRQTQHWGREMHERAGWRCNFGDGRTLFDRHVAIHGFGRIARALVKLLVPFRVRVSAYSEGVPHDFIRQHGVEPLPSLEALFGCGADILAELEALTPRSRFSVREEHLRALREGAVFVNTGRGSVVDEAALVQIATEGWLRIALDVYDVEPVLPDSPLRGPAHVTLMPHVSGPTPDCFPSIGRATLDNLHRWKNGEPLHSEVTPAAYDIST